MVSTSETQHLNPVNQYTTMGFSGNSDLRISTLCHRNQAEQHSRQSSGSNSQEPPRITRGNNLVGRRNASSVVTDFPASTWSYPILTVLIEYPLCDISIHIVQSPWIRLQFTNGMPLIIRGLNVPRMIFEVIRIVPQSSRRWWSRHDRHIPIQLPWEDGKKSPAIKLNHFVYCLAANCVMVAAG